MPSTPADGPRVRIGELSRRTGVGADRLRAWERRYGLLRPERSEGGFRLYGREDERRVRAMKTLIESGASAAEAARLAVADVSRGAGPESPGEPSLEASDLAMALERFDGATANAILDEALTRLTVEGVAERLVLPVMRDIGRRWRSGELSVAQEHFATGLIRGRLLALGRNWGAGVGPMAVLACPPDERHDVGLVVFGVVLRSRGWRITYLGPDTPIETIATAVAGLRPAAVVLAALDAERFEAVADEIRALGRDAHVLLAGAGADAELAKRLGVDALDPDPIQGALHLPLPSAST
ncbi:MAG TPA: MerR family transcriptional regulator [Solirubrobacterales bacterium]|nr:MerR family transcriptional regulator [Solirubrobacterales bacterium]